MNPEGLFYTKEHEWLRIEGDIGTVGITDHAQQELGDVVFVETAPVGTRVEAGKHLGTIESVKAVSEIFAPASGEILEINSTPTSSPEVVNQDAYGKGWLVRIRLDQPTGAGLMSAAQYSEYTAS